MRSLVAVFIVFVLLVVGVYFLFGGSQKSGTTNQGGATTSSAQPSAEANSEASITYSESGFSPSSVTISSGGKINWVNNSSKKIEVASDPHPTHADNREISGGEFVLKIAPGEKKPSTLTKTGTFGYHNHLVPSHTGSITVK